MRIHTLDAVEERIDGPVRQTPGALWSAASGRFQPVRLRAAIVARGWTVAEFSAASGVSRACLYNVLRHQAASDRTVVRITDAGRPRARELGRLREAWQVDTSS